MKKMDLLGHIFIETKKHVTKYADLTDEEV
jgi:hypothetical protein